MAGFQVTLYGRIWVTPEAQYTVQAQMTSAKRWNKLAKTVFTGYVVVLCFLTLISGLLSPKSETGKRSHILSWSEASTRLACF
jgi:hypothetical protein